MEKRMANIKPALNRMIFEEDVGKSKTDVIALLILYHQSSKPHKANNNWDILMLSDVKVEDAVRILQISDRRVRKARKVLKEIGYIKDYTEMSNKGTVQHFVQITL